MKNYKELQILIVTITISLKMVYWGCWVAQSVKCLTPNFGSDYDLRVMRSSLTSGSMLGMEFASDSLFPSFGPSPAHYLFLSLPLSLKKNGILDYLGPQIMIFILRNSQKFQYNNTTKIYSLYIHIYIIYIYMYIKI